MRTLQELVSGIEEEARRAEFPIDQVPYQKAGRDPHRPILYAGSLEAPVCSFGRDLGAQEVLEGQPQVGPSGRLVRQGVCKVLLKQDTPLKDEQLQEALSTILLTNTVPYKPPGNKAYAEAVKKRFRPFIAEFLAHHWKGDRIICLGTEAFKWFASFVGKSEIDAFWKRDDRYEAELPCELTASLPDGQSIKKMVVLCPLPHPSPLNQQWYPKFPGLLEQRLAAIET